MVNINEGSLYSIHNSKNFMNLWNQQELPSMPNVSTDSLAFFRGACSFLLATAIPDVQYAVRRK
jgi:hypothetical protein